MSRLTEGPVWVLVTDVASVPVQGPFWPNLQSFITDKGSATD